MCCPQNGWGGGRRINILYLPQNRGDNTCISLSRRTISIRYVCIPQLGSKSNSSTITTYPILLNIKPFKKFTENKFDHFPQEAAALCTQHTPGTSFPHAMGQSVCFFSYDDLLFTQKQIRCGMLVDCMPLTALIHIFAWQIKCILFPSWHISVLSEHRSSAPSPTGAAPTSR